jgi:hypothetical protein
MQPSLDSHKTNVVFEDGGKPSRSLEFDWESVFASDEEQSQEERQISFSDVTLLSRSL